MSVYLNECPVCGGKAELIHAYESRTSYKAQDAYYCECPQCGKSTDEYLSEEEAANVWNKSGTGDLKDTEERIVRSVIIKPFKVWLDTFSRIFLLLLGPVFLSFLAYSSKFDIAWWLWTAYGIIFVMWLGFGIPVYVKFAAQRNRLIRHIPKENRAANRFAVMMGFVAAVIALELFFMFILLPIAKISIYAETLSNDSAPMM